MRLGDFDGARKIVEEQIERIGNSANTGEQWRLRFIRAEVLEAHGRVEEALRYLESFAAPDAGDPESRAALKLYRGSYAGFLGRYLTSHGLLCEAETEARDAGLLEVLGDVYLSRAFILFRQKDYASSDRVYRSALDLSEKVGGWCLRGHGLWGVGKNLMIQGRYREAMPWLENSLAIFEKADAPLAVAMVWSELAVCYLGIDDDAKAMELFRKAERVNCERGVIHNYQVVLANIGNVYLHRRDYFTAISYYQRALALAGRSRIPFP
jgi:tetratricopeptide (TPR) repeat protein